MSRPATTKWTTRPQRGTPSYKLRSAHARTVHDASAVAQPTGAGPSRTGNRGTSVPNAQAPNNTGTQHESQRAAIELLQDILGQVRRTDATRPLIAPSTGASSQIASDNELNVAQVLQELLAEVRGTNECQDTLQGIMERVEEILRLLQGTVTQLAGDVRDLLNRR